MLLLLLLLSGTAFGQNEEGFRLRNDPVPVVMNGETVINPFFGGFNRPRIQWLDWDDDGDVDLFLLDEDGRIRFYANEGGGDFPLFRLKSTAFQNIMQITWFYFRDFDNDGKWEMMTTHPENVEEVVYWENVSDSLIYSGAVLQPDGSPVVTELFMTPTCADIDADGDEDFFSGNFVGTVTFYENVGWNNGIPVFQWITNTWQDISIIGNNRHGASALQFIDLDNDGDLDLSWGDYYHQSLYIIWNLGAPYFPVMDIFNITDAFPENDPISTAGQNMPGFADVDEDGDPDLMISVLSGAFGSQLVNNLFFYENTGIPGQPYFEFRTDHFLGSIDLLTDAAPELVDIDGDGDYDLFVGNGYEPTSFPWTGRIYFFRNTGDAQSPAWTLEDPQFLGTSLGNNLSPEFGDLDNDGDMDLLIGNSNGFIRYFRNDGTAQEFSFTDMGDLPGIDLTGHANPALADIDGDGFPDLATGETSGEIRFFRNTGHLLNLSFEPWDELNSAGVVSSRSAPCFIDLNNDGLMDILTGSEYENLKALINTGSSFQPEFSPDETMNFPHFGKNLIVSVKELTGPGELHMLAGISTGGMYHLSMITCEDGDENGDGTLDILDVVMLADLILEGEPFPQSGPCTRDMNDDGQVDILDLVVLVFHILGISG